jgi:hypothetical protein
MRGWWEEGEGARQITEIKLDGDTTPYCDISYLLFIVVSQQFITCLASYPTSNGVPSLAYAARYVFRCAYDAQEQLTRLFDFVGPTAIALWNLRWQVHGFLNEVPQATSQDLSNRFAFGSGMRGGEIRRACVDTSWDSQLGQLAGFILINAIASFEDFTARLAELVTSNDQQQRKISNSLQFPGGALAIPDAPKRDFAASFFASPSPALAGIFTRDPRTLRRYAGTRLDNLLLCYRFFKAKRNAIAHNGGRVNKEVLDNYNRFKTVATTAALGLKEVPTHSPIAAIGDPIHLDLRGVTGLTNVILHIVTTYDIDFGQMQPAEKEVVSRIKLSWNDSGQMIAARNPRREQQILARVQSANLPSAQLTPAFEAFLKSEGIIPSYA